MSATIELEPFVRYFESAAHVVRCGRSLCPRPVAVAHLGTQSTRRCICAWGTAAGETGRRRVVALGENATGRDGPDEFR
jgi:hypothetical protein